jgi:hypothetical protein
MEMKKKSHQDFPVFLFFHHPRLVTKAIRETGSPGRVPCSFVASEKLKSGAEDLHGRLNGEPSEIIFPRDRSQHERNFFGAFVPNSYRRTQLEISFASSFRYTSNRASWNSKY